MKKISETTTGSVSLKLYKVSASVTGRKSPYSLYREDISSFESGEIYDHADDVWIYKALWSSNEDQSHDGTRHLNVALFGLLCVCVCVLLVLDNVCGTFITVEINDVK